MACLHNNNLSSFKHNIMKYDETHANVYTSQLNTFLNNQIPFRNNHTKDKTQSEYNETATKMSDDEEPLTTSSSSKTNEIATETFDYKCNDSWLNTTKTTDDIYPVVVDKDKDIETATTTTTVAAMDAGEPSHHARRPMNAFLIFCKRHRTIVKNRYPHLENRAVTKILGEWWAGLEPDDKACYTELAKQYKNAFFSANPNFKWYKLPAPPLRTLNTRPGNIVKTPPPPKDPQETEEQHTQQQQQCQQQQQLFTPGKLADETQLGSITSLINPSNAIKQQKDEETDYKNYLLSPTNSTINMCQPPPKPFKKRQIIEQEDEEEPTTNQKNIVRNIFTTNETKTHADQNIFDSSLLQQALQSFVIDEAFEEGDFNLDFRALNNNTDSNLTQQELINKVVDHMCKDDDDECNTCLQDSRETRKSVRSCKGLLYAKFMAEGKLFVSKRKKMAASCSSDKVPRIELSDTIKKLAERTIGTSTKKLDEIDESREETMKKMFRAADFNLDEKIEALPSLSLDKFQQKKKENKKRKFLRVAKNTQKKMLQRSDDEKNVNLIGSRKRKPIGKPRKQSERNINNNIEDDDVDLFGLATLAEVAAKKAKIDQK